MRNGKVGRKVASVAGDEDVGVVDILGDFQFQVVGVGAAGRATEGSLDEAADICAPFAPGAGARCRAGSPVTGRNMPEQSNLLDPDRF